MPPRRSWEGLSWSEQREVLRAARRGKEHADPVIADAALRWAQGRLAPRTGFREGLVGAMLAAIDLALDSTFGGGALGMSVAERRAAKRILAAHQRAHGD